VRVVAAAVASRPQTRKQTCVVQHLPCFTFAHCSANVFDKLLHACIHGAAGNMRVTAVIMAEVYAMLRLPCSKHFLLIKML
jgi:hypothetical protein